METYIEEAKKHMQQAIDALQHGMLDNNVKDKTVQELIEAEDPSMMTAFHVMISLSLMVEEM